MYLKSYSDLHLLWDKLPAWKQKRDSDFEDQIVFSKAVQDLDFNRLNSLSDSIFDAALNRKCGIGADALERLKHYYEYQNITDLSCYNELVQFDKDLNDGNYYAQEGYLLKIVQIRILKQPYELQRHLANSQ